MKTIETTVSDARDEYITKLAKEKDRTKASLIRYALKRYCSTDGLKDPETGKRIPYPD